LADVLKTFRDENGEFFCFLGQTQRGVTDMLNVNRCSHVAFPGETIMQEAKLCTERYLRNALEDVGAFDKWALKKNIRGEVCNIAGSLFSESCYPNFTLMMI
jgi:ent-copalyl diphosphate synthase